MRKQLAALAALACVATPAAAFDTLGPQQVPGVTFYFSVPLDAPRARERTFSAGFAINGKRHHETVYVDSRLVNHFIGGGLEAKWIIAGVVAAGAAVAVASKDKSTAASYEEQKQAAGGSGGGTGGGGTGGGGGGGCPVKPTCPGG
jgi:hypothetical protein